MDTPALLQDYDTAARNHDSAVAFMTSGHFGAESVTSALPLPPHVRVIRHAVEHVQDALADGGHSAAQVAPSPDDAVTLAIHESITHVGINTTAMMTPFTMSVLHATADPDADASSSTVASPSAPAKQHDAPVSTTATSPTPTPVPDTHMSEVIKAPASAAGEVGTREEVTKDSIQYAAPQVDMDEDIIPVTGLRRTSVVSAAPAASRQLAAPMTRTPSPPPPVDDEAAPRVAPALISRPALAAAVRQIVRVLATPGIHTGSARPVVGGLYLHLLYPSSMSAAIQTASMLRTEWTNMTVPALVSFISRHHVLDSMADARTLHAFFLSSIRNCEEEVLHTWQRAAERTIALLQQHENAAVAAVPRVPSQTITTSRARSNGRGVTAAWVHPNSMAATIDTRGQAASAGDQHQQPVTFMRSVIPPRLLAAKVPLEVMPVSARHAPVQPPAAAAESVATIAPPALERTVTAGAGMTLASDSPATAAIDTPAAAAVAADAPSTAQADDCTDTVRVIMNVYFRHANMRLADAQDQPPMLTFSGDVHSSTPLSQLLEDTWQVFMDVTPPAASSMLTVRDVSTIRFVAVRGGHASGEETDGHAAAGVKRTRDDAFGDLHEETWTVDISWVHAASCVEDLLTLQTLRTGVRSVATTAVRASRQRSLSLVALMEHKDVSKYVEA